MELAQNKLRVIPPTEIALAIFYCSTDKFCNPRFKYKKLLKSTRMSSEDQTKSPIIAEDSQGVDTSPILKSQRIIPETVPLDSSVTENSVGKSQKRKSEDDCIGAGKKIKKTMEESTKMLEVSSRKIKNTKLGSRKSDNQVNNEIQGKNQVQASIKEKSVLTGNEKIVELAQVQKFVPENKSDDSRKQSKNNQMSDNNQIQESTINKNVKFNDKVNEKTDDSSSKLRESIIKTSVNKKRKDGADVVPVNDDKKNSGSESKKMKLIHNQENTNKSAWDILSSASQAEDNSRNTGKKIVKNKENILDPEEVPDSEDDSAQNIVKIPLKNFDNKNTKQKETRRSWTDEQKNRKDKRSDVSIKSGLVEFFFIKIRDTPSKPKMNSCRRNQYLIPKTRLKRENMYTWEPAK